VKTTYRWRVDVTFETEVDMARKTIVQLIEGALSTIGPPNGGMTRPKVEYVHSAVNTKGDPRK
jgi:hypothetical protein